MQVSEEGVRKYQAIHEREFGEKLTFDQAQEAANNLVGLFKVLLEIDLKDRKRKLRLKDEPKGFHLTDGTYSCGICGTNVSGESSWYDKFGIKCLICQQSVNTRIIPGSLCYKDTWYNMWELETYYDLKSATVRKLVRDGTLKARIISGENGRPYFYLFIIKENRGVLHEKPKAIHQQEENGYISIKFPKLVLGEPVQEIKDK